MYDSEILHRFKRGCDLLRGLRGQLTHRGGYCLLRAFTLLRGTCGQLARSHRRGYASLRAWSMWSAYTSHRARFVTSSRFLSPAICGPLLVALLAFVPAPPLQVSDSLHVCMGMLPGPAEREVRGSERDSC